MNCPHCKNPIDDNFVIASGMSLLGKRGRGARKARPSDTMRQAARKSWDPATSKRFPRHQCPPLADAAGQPNPKPKPKESQ